MTASDAEEIIDSPTDRVRAYVESDGRKGQRCYGVDALLLTTRGRRTGQLRRTAPYYVRDGDRDRFAARAHTATATERQSLWEIRAKIFPTYDSYQAKARREIPVVILDRA